MRIEHVIILVFPCQFNKFVWNNYANRQCFNSDIFISTYFFGIQEVCNVWMEYT